MKTRILFLILSCISTTFFAQLVDLEWAGVYDCTSLIRYDEMCMSDSGYVYTVGHFWGTLDMDLGPDSSFLTYNSSSSTESDLFIQKLDSLGNLVWARNIPKLVIDEARHVTVDPMGNVYLTGSFTEQIDFDPGPGSTILPGNGSDTNGFLLKLDPNGDFLWVRQITANSAIGVRNEVLMADDSGHVYLGGFFFNTIYFGIGPSADSLEGFNDHFFAKYDSNGNFLWAGLINGPAALSGTLTTIEIGSDQSVYVAGRTYDTTYFSFPNWNETIFAPQFPGTLSMYALKLDSHGNSLWLRYFEGPTISPKQMTLDSDENLLCTGSFVGSIDFDPDTSDFTLTSSNNSNMFLLKLDSSGHFMWAKQIGEAGSPNPSSIHIDERGNIFTAGKFSGDADFDPGSGSAVLSAFTSWGSGFILKLDSLGNFVWVNELGRDFIKPSLVMHKDSLSPLYIACEFLNPIDIDLGLDSTILTPIGRQVAMIRYSQGDCDNFTIIIDSVLNSSCTDSGYASILPLNEIGPYSYDWDTTPSSSDSVIYSASAGLFTVTVNSYSGCQNTRSVLIGGPETSGFNLGANMVTTEFRPGFQTPIWLDAFNEGCTPMASRLCLVLDSLVVYDSAMPAPDMIIGDTLIWDVLSLSYDSGHFQPSIFVRTSLGAMIEDQVCFDLAIKTNTGYLDSTMDLRQYCYPILNSYDPNDKRVFPTGSCTPGYINHNQPLTYTIRFQNTGNADAVNIHILDSLDEDLDLTTLKVVGQSHEPMITEILPENILQFRFDSIHLPDSTSNEPESHGFVIFEVSPDTGLVNGTLIENQVGIYFDFNPPIITNTVRNTVVDQIPLFEQTLTETACTSFTLNGQTYTSSGDYTQEFMTIDGCDSSVTLHLTIGTLAIGINQDGSNLIASIPNAAYQWLDCANNNTVIPAATNQTFTPNQSGNYAVIVNQETCTDTSECFFFSSVGLYADLESELNYYPNPTSGVLNVDLGKQYGIVQISIYDILGQKLGYQAWYNHEQVQIQFPDISGLYFIKVFADGKEAILKVQRE